VKAQVELRPEATLPDLSKIQVTVEKYENPTDAEEKEIQSVVERMTTLETVIDRPTVATDIVNLDFTGYVNGEPIRGGAAKNYRLDLANNNFIEGFSEQIVGHKIGEEFKINVTFPKDYHDNALSGKEAEFTVKVNEIKQKVVPQLTDELAQKVGAYQNVDELKAEIQKYLKENEERENTFRKQKALIEEVVKQAQVEIPDTMINREARLLMEEVKQRLKSQGLSWEQFLDSQGHETMWENLRQEAQQRIKTSLTFGAIAKQENIAVTEDEFSTQVKELAQMSNIDEKSVMRQLANNMQAAQAMNDQLLSQKIVDFLMERATFTFVEEKEAPKPETPAEAAPVAAAIEGEEFEVLTDE
jgi:trigger factor